MSRRPSPPPMPKCGRHHQFYKLKGNRPVCEDCEAEDAAARARVVRPG